MYTVFKANDYQPRRITALESKRKKAAKISGFFNVTAILALRGATLAVLF